MSYTKYMPKETRSKTQAVSKKKKKKPSLPQGMSVGSEKHLDYVYNLFVRWSALPPSERKPPTAKDFSKAFKVTAKQIADFKERKGYYDQLEQHAKDWGRAKLPELIHTLYHKSKESRKSQDIERFQKMVTERRENEGNTFNTVNLINPSNEQYEQILKREARELDVQGQGELPSPSSEEKAD